MNDRAYRAFRNVLPPAARIERRSDGTIVVNGRPIDVRWIGRGWLADVRPVLTDENRPEVVAAVWMSPGARRALADESIGWVDETGAAEVAIDSIVVSKSGRPPRRVQQTTTWTPAVLAVSEALLVGTRPTTEAVKETTGLSHGSCVNALRFLTMQGFLVADAPRGPRSARRIADMNELLQAYAAAVAEADPAPELEVGVTWRAFVFQLAETGKKWDAAQWEWACTGQIAAAVLAPFITTVGVATVYVNAETISGLESAATDADLEPLEGGRLRLRPFPTVAVPRLSTVKDGLRIAPWPRVYADLRLTRVRGEEAAEHLRDVVHRGG